MPQSDQCISCLHHLGGNICFAFPDGIPYKIISGQIDHDTIQPKQQGDFVWKEYDLNEQIKLFKQLAQEDL